MAVKFQGGRAVPAGGVSKVKMSQSIAKLEQAIEQARQSASEMMGAAGASQGYNIGHIKDIQRQLQSMYSDLSMLRSSLNAIR